MILCEWDTPPPEGHHGQYCVHLYAFVSYRRLSSQFQFSLSAVNLVYIYLSGPDACLGQERNPSLEGGAGWWVGTGNVSAG